MRIVIALGGNAVSQAGQEGTIPQQFGRTHDTARLLAELIIAGHQLIITHGNGPQVGNVMRRVEISRQQVYPLTLDIAVADTQGGMGYMIARCLMDELAVRGSPRICSTVVTTVLVDAADPAFANPTKPIGSFMSRKVAEEHAQREGWKIVDDAGRGYRRVVPSPIPMEIVELPVIRRLIDAGELVVACGGGGVPVVRQPDGRCQGVEAVVDKDRTSALLAAGIHADLLAILTGVDQVQINFGKPDARPVSRMTIDEARRYLAAGEFPAGSMGPKIEAAADYLERCGNPSAEVLITSCEQISAALKGHTGTRIVRK